MTKYKVLKFKDVYETYLDVQIQYLIEGLDYNEAKDIVEGKYKPMSKREICQWYVELVDDTSNIKIYDGTRCIFKRG